MNVFCRMGFHKWMVKWFFITGDAKCDRCGCTGIATSDGIINIVTKGESKTWLI